MYYGISDVEHLCCQQVVKIDVDKYKSCHLWNTRVLSQRSETVDSVIRIWNKNSTAEMNVLYFAQM